MGTDYPDVLVGEVASSISETHRLDKEKLIFLNTSDILHGKFLHHTYSSVKDWPGQAKKSIRKDDILLSEIRPANGRWALVEDDADDFVVSTKLMVIRCRKDRILPRYLYQFLTSAETTSWLQHLAESRSGTFPQITFDQVASLEIPFPPLEKQKRIAHILGTLDDKIELNRRMNATLEAMARSLFQSWFFDFDPVRTKVSELIADGIMEIGDGYRAKNSELAVEGLPFVRAGDLDSGFDLVGAERLSFASVAKATSKLSRSGDVAFTSKGTVGRIARVDATLPQFVYAPQVCYWRSSSPAKLHPAVLYCWMKSADFGHQLHSRAGQTDMAPYISLKDQRGLTMPVFPPSHMETGERLQLFLDRQAANTTESRTLAALRDALLPKLLSGALRPTPSAKVI